MDYIKNAQHLGCYQLFQIINQLDNNHSEYLLKILKKQYAFFVVFIEEMEQTCSSCVDKDGEIVKAPNMKKVELWRKKLHDFYHDCLLEIFAYLETNICVSKKTRKKRFLKIKTSEVGDLVQDLNESGTKPNEHFYSKHVWKEVSDPKIVIRKFYIYQRTIIYAFEG